MEGKREGKEKRKAGREGRKEGRKKVKERIKRTRKKRLISFPANISTIAKLSLPFRLERQAQSLFVFCLIIKTTNHKCLFFPVSCKKSKGISSHP